MLASVRCFEVSDRVEHCEFGPGVVVEIEGVGEAARATVHFHACSFLPPKRLLLSSEPLTKIEV